MIAAFGDKIFEVSSNRIYTIDGIKISAALGRQTQKLAGKKPSTYIEGAELQKLVFTIPLNFSLGMDVKAEIEYWVAQCEGGKAQQFNLGGMPLSLNKWIIIKADADSIVILQNGKIQSAQMKLTFEEYVRSGSAAQSSSSTPSFNLDNVKSWEASLEEDKSTKKRTNPSAEKSLAAGPRSSKKMMI